MPTSLFTAQMKEANSGFSQEDLTKYWTEYADSLTDEKIHLKNTLKSCKPELKADYMFEVAVFNPGQKNEITNCNQNIVGFLCNKLNNNLIKMDIRIVEKDEIEMIYTPTEKYDYLSKKNSNIDKLIAIFSLTLE